MTDHGSSYPIPNSSSIFLIITTLHFRSSSSSAFSVSSLQALISLHNLRQVFRLYNNIICQLQVGRKNIHIFLRKTYLRLCCWYRLLSESFWMMWQHNLSTPTHGCQNWLWIPFLTRPWGSGCFWWDGCWVHTNVSW